MIGIVFISINVTNDILMFLLADDLFVLSILNFSVGHVRLAILFFFSLLRDSFPLFSWSALFVQRPFVPLSVFLNLFGTRRKLMINLTSDKRSSKKLTNIGSSFAVKETIYLETA
jgi:hypothetical protein